MALLTLLSCHKKNSTTCSNTVTVTDDANTYTDCGEPLPSTPVLGAGTILRNCVDIGLIKPNSTGYTYDTGYSIQIIAAKNYPFVLSLQSCLAHSGGAGIYTLIPRDSAFNNYVEEFSGGQSYECSSGTVTVTHADSGNVAGSFTLNIFNATNNKVITGTFNANKPAINY